MITGPVLPQNLLVGESRFTQSPNRAGVQFSGGASHILTPAIFPRESRPLLFWSTRESAEGWASDAYVSSGVSDRVLQHFRGRYKFVKAPSLPLGKSPPFNF